MRCHAPPKECLELGAEDEKAVRGDACGDDATSKNCGQSGWQSRSGRSYVDMVWTRQPSGAGPTEYFTFSKNTAPVFEKDLRYIRT
jgi:hypothetical protein